MGLIRLILGLSELIQDLEGLILGLRGVILGLRGLTWGLRGLIWGLRGLIWGLRGALGGDVRTDVRTSGNSPLCPTGHRPFGAAAQKVSKILIFFRFFGQRPRRADVL